jgi:hypothetical protein
LWTMASQDEVFDLVGGARRCKDKRDAVQG